MKTLIDTIKGWFTSDSIVEQFNQIIAEEKAQIAEVVEEVKEEVVEVAKKAKTRTKKVEAELDAKIDAAIEEIKKVRKPRAKKTN